MAARTPASTQQTGTPPGSPPVVGLTGGMGAGKSTVAALLAERGAYVIDADRVGHAVLAPEGEAYAEVVAAFGRDILAADGTVDRKALGARVFGDAEALQRLNAISHPRMAERMAREIEAVRARPAAERPPLIVLDAAILLEAGWDRLCDAVWTVEVSEETAVARLAGRGIGAGEARRRLARQLGNAERAARAGRVIRNEGSPADLAAHIERLWAEVAGDEAG